MNTYDVYGLQNVDISSVVEKLEIILQVKFIAHESDYVGEHYLATLEKTEYDICYNDIGEEGWREEDFQEYSIIFYVTLASNPDKLLKNILDCFPACKPLRRSEIVRDVVMRNYLYENEKFELKEETNLKNKKRRY